jgi:NAD(P)H-flavin reductase
VLLVGARVGVAPLRALVEALPYAPGEATLLYRHTGRPLFEQELHVLARERGLRMVFLPGHRRAPDSWLGDGGPPVPDADATAAYALGREVARWLAGRPGRTGLVVWADGTAETVASAA